MRDVRVGVERDVRERHGIADEPRPAVEVTLHCVERAVPGSAPFVEPIRELLSRPARVREPEAHDCNRRLMVVLLEEHPLQHLCALERIARNELRPLAEEPEDRTRFTEGAPVVEHDRRNSERRVEAAEQLRPVRPVGDVDLAALVLHAEVREQEPHLVTVARDLAVVEEHEQTLPQRARSARMTA